ncbi:MAG: rod shape-determining protein MreD [Muribaculaceae bacterium]|nr:rod shape-determining protein MreD [Muribaculaceae bacterium]
MAKTVLNIIVTFLILLILQVTVFSHICLFNVAVPFVFLYAILRLPMSLAPSWVMIIGFFSGLFIDIFTDTPGMNALASTILSALRRPVLKMYVNRDDDITSDAPSAKSLGGFTYAKYAFTLILAYCLVLFIIEASSFTGFSLTSMRIVFSTILSFALVLGIDSITGERQNDKKTPSL